MGRGMHIPGPDDPVQRAEHGTARLRLSLQVHEADVSTQGDDSMAHMPPHVPWPAE